MMPHPHDPSGAFRTNPGAEAFQILVDGVTRAVEGGRFRETDVMAVSQALWSTIHGLVSLQIMKGENFPWVDRDRLIDLTIETILHGLEPG